MSDIVKRLRELEEWIRNPTGEPFNMNTDLFDEAADEIESLRTRLEIDPSHPYDGIYARDETILGLEKQIESLRQKTQYWPDNAERDAVIRHQKEEIERLRARVTELEGQHKGLVLNNAILRERPDLPLNRIPAARAMAKLYEENERLRAALEPELLGKLIYETWIKAADGPEWLSYEEIAHLAPDDAVAIQEIVEAIRIRAALEHD